MTSLVAPAQTSPLYGYIHGGRVSTKKLLLSAGTDKRLYLLTNLPLFRTAVWAGRVGRAEPVRLSIY